MEKRIGKIQKIKFGFGGYQDVMMGLSVTLGSDSWGVSDFKGYWSKCIEISENTKWTEADRNKSYSDTMRFINDLLIDANKQTIDQLKDVPVEVFFNGNTISSWRILTEVI